jgi:Flp pilus assembly pilin Flp
MLDLIHEFWSDQEGQDTAEYALLLSLIALALIGAIIAFRGAIAGKFQEATSQLGSA